MFLLNHLLPETSRSMEECGRKSALRLARIFSYSTCQLHDLMYQVIMPLAKPTLGMVNVIGSSVVRSRSSLMNVRKGSMQAGGSGDRCSL